MRILPALHQNEYYISSTLIRHLITSQAPSFSHLKCQPIVPGGTDHIMVRLGDDFVARFPRYPGAIPATKVDREWLPRVKRCMSLSIPQIVHTGEPDLASDLDRQYPAPWSILSYLPGESAKPLDYPVSQEQTQLLIDNIADLLSQIRSITVPYELHRSDVPQSYRTGILSDRLPHLINALDLSSDALNSRIILETFQYDLSNAKPYTGPAMAAHGDLQPANLILSISGNAGLGGRLKSITGVIDWSGLSFGDPAVDLLPAWMLFDSQGRMHLRRRLEHEGLIDKDMWRRGRAWALSIGAIAFPYYRKSREDHAKVSYRTIKEVVQDVHNEGGVAL